MEKTIRHCDSLFNGDFGILTNVSKYLVEEHIAKKKTKLDIAKSVIEVAKVSNNIITNLTAYYKKGTG